MLAECGQDAGPVGDPPRRDFLDQPVGEKVARTRPVGGGAGSRRCEQLVRGRLHEPGPARVVGAGPALLVVPCIPNVVEVGPPRWRRGVERLTAIQLDSGDQHVHMDPVGAVHVAVLDGGPGVAVVRESGEREVLEVRQHTGDLLPGRAVAWMERDHRRGVAVHRAEAVRDRRHLLRIADQDLDVLPLPALVVPLSGQVGGGPGGRSCAVRQELDVHVSALPRDPLGAKPSIGAGGCRAGSS